VIRLKHAAINCLFLLAAVVASAPMGALAIVSRIAERMESRARLQSIRRSERAFNRAARKSWLDE
jgi:hypothetical protein